MLYVFVAAREIDPYYVRFLLYKLEEGLLKTSAAVVMELLNLSIELFTALSFFS